MKLSDLKNGACLAGAMGLALLAGCSTAKEVVTTIGGAVYKSASVAVNDYCHLPVATRMALQLVVAGRAYNSGLCEVVLGNATLDQQIAKATQVEVDKLIQDAIAKAVTDGRITAEQAAALHVVPSNAGELASAVQVTP